VPVLHTGFEQLCRSLEAGHATNPTNRFMDTYSTVALSGPRAACDYLADLNQEQRCAVKHGVKDGSALDAGPLLVIAGAGSGKTKTLAHRVAHLVVNGIDPHRILLLTFSRRAALDMTSRVRRITGAAMGTGHIDLPWAGTFHAVGAHVLREYASRIGLKPSHLGVYLIGENLNVLGPHGAGPVECCKTIFAAQNNNIDSEMNAGAQHRFQIPKTVRVSLRSSLAQRRPHFRNRAAKKRL
jgi:hypothetical protein